MTIQSPILDVSHAHIDSTLTRSYEDIIDIVNNNATFGYTTITIHNTHASANALIQIYGTVCYPLPTGTGADKSAWINLISAVVNEDDGQAYSHTENIIINSGKNYILTTDVKFHAIRIIARGASNNVTISINASQYKR